MKINRVFSAFVVTALCLQNLGCSGMGYLFYGLFKPEAIFGPPKLLHSHMVPEKVLHAKEGDILQVSLLVELRPFHPRGNSYAWGADIATRANRLQVKLYLPAGITLEEQGNWKRSEDPALNRRLGTWYSGPQSGYSDNDPWSCFLLDEPLQYVWGQSSDRLAEVPIRLRIMEEGGLRPVLVQPALQAGPGTLWSDKDPTQVLSIFMSGERKATIQAIKPPVRA